MMIPALLSFGDHVRLPEYPTLDGASRQFWGRPVVWVCDHCTRVQGGLTKDVSEAPWADQATYMTVLGFSFAEVWWFHTTCWTCQRFSYE